MRNLPKTWTTITALLFLSAASPAVADHGEVELDYTQDTLPILDHYISIIPDRTSEDVLGLVVPMLGAYFGEVVRRRRITAAIAGFAVKAHLLFLAALLLGSLVIAPVAAAAALRQALD